PSVNSWLEDELYQQYLHDRKTVDTGWTQVFDANGHTTPATPTAAVVETRKPEPAPLAPGEQLVPLRGPALKIAENMTASLAIPVATSQRVMPVRVLEENRRAINHHRKISYTHLIAWAIVKALKKVPAINQAYSEAGTDSYRITREHVNLGV